MPQGKMKVKAKGAPPAKKDKSKKSHGGIQKGGNNLKKGKFTIAPKKQHHQAVFKFKQNVRKEINAKNEVELKEKAQTFEAKDFNTLNSEAGASAN